MDDRQLGENKKIVASLKLTLERNEKGEELLLIEKDGDIKDFTALANNLIEFSKQEKQEGFLAKEVLILMGTIVEYSKNK